ncbi:hypothetical protein [Halorhabdus amylolytica]|uniref:hypothetical protein n=1 Tax=Halorhabdus amylolytica TaxID=2559573 RepID=UPI0010AA8800|nr:hypothetical protein [Halorhabdus amylolytica]
MPDIEPLETPKGFLTEQMRSYLADPEDFVAEHGKQKSADVRNRIRNAREAAIKQLELLDNRTEEWTRQQPQVQSFPDPEPHVDIIPCHRPLPDDHAVDFAIHEDTLRALEGTQRRLSELAVNFFVDQIDRNQIPDEYNSKSEYREHLQENRQDLRTLYDAEKRPAYEIFRGNDFATIDDVIRLGLQFVVSPEDYQEFENEKYALLPGINQDIRYELIKAYAESLDKSYLR